MTILITGARGKIGQGVIDRLHASGLPIRAASARPAELTVPAGVATAELALDRPETFAAALRDVRQVFLYPNPEGIDAFVKSAHDAGVEHVVLLSSSAVLNPDAEHDPLASHNLAVERALTASGLTTTLLRPDAFATNTLGWARLIAGGLPVELPYPDADLAPIHSDDIADIAAAILTAESATTGALTSEALKGAALKGRALTLTGPEALTFRAQLAIVSEVLGRDVALRHITHDEAERQMLAYMPAQIVGSLLSFWAGAAARPAAIAGTTESLLSRPARTFRQWVRENAAAFTPGSTR
ncbi:NAD(P)H-binding protein [Nonomuraea sp. NBC_01738]|uniref:NAD(P)H-binding protein n=1 Tax=Nonomuraea sp. NBC_01738 TaxID=2976003 RepID=UPI002E115D88|nr:NAD(P)H-binding protein [Nonomuraea sp. NBC_01738]